ncbi:MAG: hypothetical protein JW825_06920, partial [Candidatus Methanofastidiosa archaeon]|nr:hypothetical protein [Candidatus Methanofastidiosa archaeon]
MVSNKNDDKKGKTKLKKRKLEKHKRKQLERNFLHRNRKAVLSAAFLVMIIIASFIGFNMYQSSEER